MTPEPFTALFHLKLASATRGRTIGSNSNEVTKIMAGKRKKHLRYQERKHGSVKSVATDSAASMAVGESVDPAPVKATKTTAKVSKKEVVDSHPELYSQLPPGEVAYVRRELRYIVVIAGVVAVLYTAIWFLLAHTTIEQRLFDLLKISTNS